jgi:hypothetical protein
MSLRRCGSRAIALVGLVVLVLAAFLMMVSRASASEKLSQGEIKLLKSILPHVSYIGAGVGGKATIRFSGVNVQVVNGEGKTASVNGAGNLVIGYDENAGKHAQIGSHDLILGEEQTFTSFGAILGGVRNIASGVHSFVVGEGNTASGERTSVSGGSGNTASETSSSVSGGSGNTASGLSSAVSGGSGNRANWINTSVSGGEHNEAGNLGDSVSGGRYNYADGGGYAYGEEPGGASVSGGEHNRAFQIGSSISGGAYNEAIGCGSWVGGGYKNVSGSASGFCEGGPFTAIFGGKELKAPKEYEAIP